MQRLVVSLALVLAAGCQMIAGADRDRIPDGGTATGGATGGSTTSAGGGGGAGGTGGAAAPCITAHDCPGADSECRSRTCAGGICGTLDVADGTATAFQVARDCKRRVCDGAGHVKLVDDPGDVLDDGLSCTVDACVAGSPRNTLAPSGTACGAAGEGKVCDALGACVDCVSGAQCGVDLCVNNRCLPPSCLDGSRDGDETDVNCGGKVCGPCDTGKVCLVPSDCASGVCGGAPRACAWPTCADGVANGDETDVDCGGSCAARCLAGQRCHADADCTGGACTGSICLPTCTDAVANGGESGVDCGGGVCPPCPAGGGCRDDADCAEGWCQAGRCVPATCGDGVKNAGETDVDCGGLCAPCGPGRGCHGGDDCASHVCAGTLCAMATCQDGVRNGAEIGVDCGGGCGTCPDGQPCGAAADCASGICLAGVCTPVGCTDAVRDLAETDVDCGGGACPGCPGGGACLGDGDCDSRLCVSGICTSARCDDHVANGGESDVDCGGPCSGCALGKKCGAQSDCALLACVAGLCVVPTCGDHMRNGQETGVDCGGPTCAKCPGGQGCASGADCASGSCTSGVCDATCSDGVKDGSESGVDCGGTCPGCPLGGPCSLNSDCATASCQGGVCAQASCTDGGRNGTETDVDCGGANCPACALGKSCVKDDDCRSYGCRKGKCVEVLLFSEVRTHSSTKLPNPGWDNPYNNEFVELYNVGLDPITFDNTWAVRHQSAQGGCQGGSVSTPVAQRGSLRLQGTGAVIPSHRHFMMTGFQYEPPPASDAQMISSALASLADGGSIFVVHGAELIDGLCYYYDPISLGFINSACGVPSPYVCRGTPVSNLPHDGGSNPLSDVDASLERKWNATHTHLQDTGDSAADFKMIQPSNPQNLASPAEP